MIRFVGFYKLSCDILRRNCLPKQVIEGNIIL